MIAASAFYEARSFGDPSIDVGAVSMTTDGGKVSSFGVEALIGKTGGGTGLHFNWAIGISSNKWTRDNWEDLTKTGYHIGPGIEIGLPSNIGPEIKGKFELVPTDGEGSRKNAIVSAGVNYHLGIL